MSLAVVAVVGAGIALAGGATKLGMSLAGRKDRIAEQTAAKEEMEKKKREYDQLDTSNLAADVRNKFTNMENTYEDMTVNQQQAQFEAQQGAQQRANIMSNMAGAAGGSGIAALAQAMAQQGQLATQRASASIGMQEAQIQKLRAGEGSRLQTLERQGEQYAQGQRLKGAETARGLEYSKTGTLLGMSQQRLGAANLARAQARAQQMSAFGDLAKAGTQLATAGMKMGAPGVDEIAPDVAPLENTFSEGLNLKTTPGLGYKPGQLGGGTGLGFGGIQTTLPKFNQLTGKFE